MALTGIPSHYDSERYTYSDQLEELQTLCIGDHKSDSSDDLEDDAPTLTNQIHNDKGFDSEHSHSRSLTPVTPPLFDLSDSDQSHRSLTDSIFNHLKYDRMEPLMFGAQSPRRDSLLNNNNHMNNNIKLERRDSNTIKMISPPPPQQPPLPHTHASSSPNTPRTDIISSKLINLNQIKLPHAVDTDRTQSNDDAHAHADIEDDKIRDLMHDIWWFFDSDDEIKQYKQRTNEEFKENILILFKSFHVMHHSGYDVHYALCKLLGPQMIAYAKSEAVRFMELKQFESAIKAFNILIRFCFILKDCSDASSYYVQRSECHFKLNHYEEALCDAQESYKADACFERGYLMHCKVLMALSDYDEAKKVCISGYSLNGKCKKKFAIGIQSATKHIEMRKKSKQLDIKHLELGSMMNNTQTNTSDVEYKTMTVHITNDINTKRIQWNDINITNVHRTNCTDDITQRLLFWMQVYSEWNERYRFYLSLNELMRKICGIESYDATHLYNDYIHAVSKHMDGCSKPFGECQEMQCSMRKRHAAPNKYTCGMKERKRRYHGYTQSEYVCLMQLLDQMHCCLMHYDHNPLCCDENIYDVRWSDACGDDDDDKEGDYTLSEIHSLLNGKEGKKNKFVLDMPLALGLQFVYWPCFEKCKLYCSAKYETLKYELLHNNIYKLNELVWNDLLTKAQWIQRSYALNARAKAKDKGVENERLGIGVGCNISLRHILVLLMYCNCVELRHAFIVDHKRMEDVREMRQRNSEIALFCMFLYEAVLFYGEEMSANQYFYGGICSESRDGGGVLFNEYSLSFKQPISMTSCLNVMVKVVNEISNANNETIIVKYGASDSYGCCYFDLQMFSDHPQQKEVVFFNCKLSIYDVLHFDVNYGDESKQILQSNDKYIESLILFEKMVIGHFFTSQYDTKTQHLYEKIVTKMIHNHIHPPITHSATINAIEIPKYVQNLFTFYCDNLDEIWLIKSELSSLSDPLRMYFIASQTANRIMMDSSNRDCYGPFLQMMETNHRECAQTFVNFVSEYVWYIAKSAFHQFLALKCNQSMLGPKVYVPVPTSYDYIVFQPHCYRSLNNAPLFGAFGLTIKELPHSIDKIKFEYQVTCKESQYILLVPSTNKWYSKGDNICFKSFKSKLLNSHLVKNRNEFSYRFSVKIIQIHKT